MAAEVQGYQGGHAYLVFSPQGSRPLDPLGITGAVAKEYDKKCRSQVVALSATPSGTKIALPKEGQKPLNLQHPLIVVQMFVPAAARISIEFFILDSMGHRRFIFSNSFPSMQIDPLHVKIPFGENLPRGRWLELCFDLHSMYRFVFADPSMACRSVEALTIGSVCRVRRIFTLKELLGSEALSANASGLGGACAGPREWSAALMHSVPSIHAFPSGVEYEAIVLRPSTIVCAPSATVQPMTAPAGIGRRKKGSSPSSSPLDRRVPSRPATTAIRQSPTEFADPTSRLPDGTPIADSSEYARQKIVVPPVNAFASPDVERIVAPPPQPAVAHRSIDVQVCSEDLPVPSFVVFPAPGGGVRGPAQEPAHRVVSGADGLMMFDDEFQYQQHGGVLRSPHGAKSPQYAVGAPPTRAAFQDDAPVPAAPCAAADRAFLEDSSGKPPSPALSSWDQLRMIRDLRAPIHHHGGAGTLFMEGDRPAQQQQQQEAGFLEAQHLQRPSIDSRGSGAPVPPQREARLYGEVVAGQRGIVQGPPAVSALADLSSVIAADETLKASANMFGSALFKSHGQRSTPGSHASSARSTPTAKHRDAAMRPGQTAASVATGPSSPLARPPLSPPAAGGGSSSSSEFVVHRPAAPQSPSSPSQVRAGTTGGAGGGAPVRSPYHSGHALNPSRPISESTSPTLRNRTGGSGKEGGGFASSGSGQYNVLTPGSGIEVAPVSINALLMRNAAADAPPPAPSSSLMSSSKRHPLPGDSGAFSGRRISGRVGSHYSEGVQQQHRQPQQVLSSFERHPASAHRGAPSAGQPTVERLSVAHLSQQQDGGSDSHDPAMTAGAFDRNYRYAHYEPSEVSDDAGALERDYDPAAADEYGWGAGVAAQEGHVPQEDLSLGRRHMNLQHRPGIVMRPTSATAAFEGVPEQFGVPIDAAAVEVLPRSTLDDRSANQGVPRAYQGQHQQLVGDRRGMAHAAFPTQQQGGELEAPTPLETPIPFPADDEAHNIGDSMLNMHSGNRFVYDPVLQCHFDQATSQYILHTPQRRNR